MVRVLAVVWLAACGRIDFAPLGGGGDGGGGGGGGGGGPSDGAAACMSFGPWSTPEPVAAVNTVANDWEPELSDDGQWLVFSTDRTGGKQHLFLSQRTGNTFGAPTELAPLTSAGNDDGPAWDGTGANLYFVSDHSGNVLLYESAFSAGTFGAPIQIASVATDAIVAPSISADNLEMLSGTSTMDAMSQLEDITRGAPNDPWPSIEVALEPLGTGWPSISADRLTVYYEGGNPTEILVATRSALDQPFVSGTPLALDDTAVEEGDPFISHDGLTYLFASTRAGGMGNADIWMSTRACL